MSEALLEEYRRRGWALVPIPAVKRGRALISSRKATSRGDTLPAAKISTITRRAFAGPRSRNVGGGGGFGLCDDQS